MATKQEVDRFAVAEAELDAAITVDGDFNAFLRFIRSADFHDMIDHKEFDPKMSMENVGDADDTGPRRLVHLKFVSGVQGKWNWEHDMQHTEFVRWRVKAKVAGFAFGEEAK